MPRLTCRNKVCARLLCLAEKFGFPADFAGCCSFTVFFRRQGGFCPVFFYRRLQFPQPFIITCGVPLFVLLKRLARRYWFCSTFFLQTGQVLFIPGSQRGKQCGHP